MSGACQAYYAPITIGPRTGVVIVSAPDKPTARRMIAEHVRDNVPIESRYISGKGLYMGPSMNAIQPVNGDPGKVVYFDSGVS